MKSLKLFRNYALIEKDITHIFGKGIVEYGKVFENVNSEAHQEKAIDWNAPTELCCL